MKLSDWAESTMRLRNLGGEHYEAQGIGEEIYGVQVN
jgi:hypothetical protein